MSWSRPAKLDIKRRLRSFTTRPDSYERLLEVFWRNIDPTDSYGQFADRGIRIERRFSISTKGRGKWRRNQGGGLSFRGIFDRPIVTEILPAKEFYPADTTRATTPSLRRTIITTSSTLEGWLHKVCVGEKPILPPLSGEGALLAGKSRAILNSGDY